MRQSRPQPVYALSSLAERMTALAATDRVPKLWTARQVKLLLEARGVQPFQRMKGAKWWVSLTDLREAFPELMGDVVFCEALAEAVQDAA